jgi:hypothetical protein
MIYEEQAVQHYVVCVRMRAEAPLESNEFIASLLLFVSGRRWSVGERESADNE